MRQSLPATLTASLCLGAGLVLAAPVWAEPTERKELGDPAFFRRMVVPVLTKAGCNGGACHGSFQGRGGFRLSLLGFDPMADFDALVQQDRGRRIFLAAPDYSLILRKATGTMAHGGGRRLVPDTEDYRIVRDWIVAGSPAPRGKDPTILRLEVAPTEITSRHGQASPVQVKAIWSDGMAQDATRWALYESTSEVVAEVSAQGVVKTRQPGRAALTVRYQGQVAAVPVTVPYSGTSIPPTAPQNGYVNELVEAEWRKLGLQPAPVAEDAEFVRRVHLDIIGTLPTTDEVRRFLTARAPDKKDRLIDALLERPEYVDYWSLKWGDLLRAHRRTLGDKGLASFNGWLRQSLRENHPADRIVRELLTAQGNLYTTGTVAFYYIDQTPEDLAETTAQLFLGIRLQCVKCHHHPFEVWSQDDYYGLAAFFSRVQRKDTKDGGRFGGSQSVRVAKGKSVMTHPNTGRPIQPQLLGGPPVAIVDEKDPREVLAQWLTRKDNPYFARNLANRYWGYLFGRGLVEPMDDMRATNPASHPALLEALTHDFTEHGFDLKHLLRTICRSRAYQLAVEIAPSRDLENTFITHHAPRQLPAEVLLDAINQATGNVEPFDGLPPGTRAIALPDPTVVSLFLETFGRTKRTSTCECERISKPDLKQVLNLANGEKLHQKLTAEQGRVARLLAAGKKDNEVIEELYLASLSRLPTASERATVAKLLAAVPSRKEGFEDLLWTLLNSAEFVFNH